MFRQTKKQIGFKKEVEYGKKRSQWKPIFSVSLDVHHIAPVTLGVRRGSALYESRRIFVLAKYVNSYVQIGLMAIGVVKM